MNESLIPINPFSRPGTIRTFTRNIVWHWTANPGATARGHVGYFGNVIGRQDPYDDKADTYASAHVFIDRTETLCIIPLDELAYHASQANPYSVGVELCIELDGSFHPNTVEQAVQLGVELCRLYNITPSDFLRHYDVTGKICPKQWVENPKEWEWFKTEVGNRLKGKGADDNMLVLDEDGWQTLTISLQTAYENGMLGDYRFVEKAYKRELTRSELDVANNLILVNSALIRKM